MFSKVVQNPHRCELFYIFHKLPTSLIIAPVLNTAPPLQYALRLAHRSLFLAGPSGSGSNTIELLGRDRQPHYGAGRRVVC